MWHKCIWAGIFTALFVDGHMCAWIHGYIVVNTDGHRTWESSFLLTRQDVNMATNAKLHCFLTSMKWHTCDIPVHMKWHTCPHAAAVAKGRTFGAFGAHTAVVAVLTRSTVWLITFRTTSPGTTGGWMAAGHRALTLTTPPCRQHVALAFRADVPGTLAAVRPIRWLLTVLTLTFARVLAICWWCPFLEWTFRALRAFAGAIVHLPVREGGDWSMLNTHTRSSLMITHWQQITTSFVVYNILPVRGDHGGLALFSLKLNFS